MLQGLYYETAWHMDEMLSAIESILYVLAILFQTITHLFPLYGVAGVVSAALTIGAFAYIAGWAIYNAMKEWRDMAETYGWYMLIHTTVMSLFLVLIFAMFQRMLSRDGISSLTPDGFAFLTSLAYLAVSAHRLLCLRTAGNVYRVVVIIFTIVAIASAVLGGAKDSVVAYLYILGALALGICSAFENLTGAKRELVVDGNCGVYIVSLLPFAMIALVVFGFNQKYYAAFAPKELVGK